MIFNHFFEDYAFLNHFIEDYAFLNIERQLCLKYGFGNCECMHKKVSFSTFLLHDLSCIIYIHFRITFVKKENDTSFFMRTLNRQKISSDLINLNSSFNHLGEIYTVFHVPTAKYISSSKSCGTLPR